MSPDKNYKTNKQTKPKKQTNFKRENSPTLIKGSGTSHEESSQTLDSDF